MSCSTRTTSRTTTRDLGPETCGDLCQHGRVTRPAVLFGGPSPEHDISVLTGLQALTALGKDGVDATVLYWARSGDFFEVDASSPPASFVEGVPRGAQRLDLVARPGGGFVREGGRLGKRAPLALTAVVNCCHGGPGEDGTLQAGARPRGRALHRTDGLRCRARDGQARVRRHHARGGAQRASPRCVRSVGRTAIPGAVHREAPVRGIEHRHRDHRRPRGSRRPGPDLAALPRWRGHRALPARGSRPQHRRPHAP